MAAPKRKTQAVHEEEILISPNGDTTADRYAKAKEQDASLSMEERVKRLREAPSIFDFNAKSVKDKKDS
jgi:hypothetical protein